jgi:ABC-type sugar transport system permease subunit
MREGEVSEHLMIMIILLGAFTSAAIIITSIVNAIQRSKRDRYVSEVSGKLVDRLGNGPDVMSFVNSEAYKNLLGGQATGRGVYATRVLNTLQTGVVMLFGGLGLFFGAGVSGSADGQAFFRIAGGIVLAVGVGLAASAAWSYLLLKRWGFLTEPATPHSHD